VFRSRKKLEQIADSKISNKEKQQRITEAFAELKLTVERTLAVMNELKTGKQLSLGAMNRMLQALGSILTYLYRKYGEPYEQTEQEVTVMIKSFYDPKIREEGRKEGRQEGMEKGMEKGMKEGKLEVARNMLELGFDIAMINRATGLSPEEIEREGSKKS